MHDRKHTYDKKESKYTIPKKNNSKLQKRKYDKKKKCKIDKPNSADKYNI